MNIIQKLKDKKIYIISPHFDDAVLSCGGLMSSLSGAADVIVVNLFTRGHDGPYTLSTKKFLRISKESDAVRLFKKRALEDKRVMQKLDAKIINLDIEDALFRRKTKSLLGSLIPEFDHVYPTYRWHVGKGISKFDYAQVEVKKKLSKIIKSEDIVLAPYGIGGHVDHIIANKVCKNNYKNLILYSDFPYNIRVNFFGHTGKKFKRLVLRPDSKSKTMLVKMYVTQFLGLFPNTVVPKHDEIYFIRRK